MSAVKIYRLVLVVVCLGVGIPGCNNNPGSTPGNRYHWETTKQEVAKVEYGETWRVYTEPVGCRVYVNDNYKGISPLTCTGGGIQAILYRIEEYPVPQKPGGPRTNVMYEWVTEPSAGSWEITAYREGFGKGTAVIHVGDQKFQETVHQYQDPRRIPEQIVVDRNILIELRPGTVPAQYPGSYW